MNVFAYVFVLGTPGGLALQESGLVTLPGEFYGAMLTLFAVFVVFGVSHLYYKRRT
jgi:hypothetical protein